MSLSSILIQPHGVVLVAGRRDRSIRHVSENAGRLLGTEASALLDRPLRCAAGEGAGDALEAFVFDSGETSSDRLTMRWDGETLHVDVLRRRRDDVVIVELEPAADASGVDGEGGMIDYYAFTRDVLFKLQSERDRDALCRSVAAEMRRITGYDRVLIWLYDSGGHGHVIADAADPSDVSLLDHRFPAGDLSDVELARLGLSPLRMIVDVDADPVGVASHGEEFVDGFDDVILLHGHDDHLGYLRERGVSAHLMLPLHVDGRLLGVVECRHGAPRRLPHDLREHARLLTLFLSAQIPVLEEATGYRNESAAKQNEAALAARWDAEFSWPSEDVCDELLLELCDADGACIVIDGIWQCRGKVPESGVHAVLEWLDAHADRNVYSTDSLEEILPDSELRGGACGLLAESFGDDYQDAILWFRRCKAVEADGSATEAYRGGAAAHARSYRKWQEAVAGRSRAWRDTELASARRVALMLGRIVSGRRLQQQRGRLEDVLEELRRTNKELDDFAYVASHDLKAPLRNIDNLAKWLSNDLGDDLPEASQRHLDLMQQRVLRMERLLDDLLKYSRAARVGYAVETVDTRDLVRDVITMVSAPDAFSIEIPGEMPVVRTPRSALEQVFLNLISNAVKHHDRADGRVEISSEDEGAIIRFTVSDDGPGIDPAYHTQIFGIFQTLKPRDEVEGSGMGLSLVKKLVEYHGGEVTLDSEEGAGARFSFTWPKDPPA